MSSVKTGDWKCLTSDCNCCKPGRPSLICDSSHGSRGSQDTESVFTSAALYPRRTTRPGGLGIWLSRVSHSNRTNLLGISPDVRSSEKMVPWPFPTGDAETAWRCFTGRSWRSWMKQCKAQVLPVETCIREQVCTLSVNWTLNLQCLKTRAKNQSQQWQWSGSHWIRLAIRLAYQLNNGCEIVLGFFLSRFGIFFWISWLVPFA